ncbi:heparinase II/III-family protein [Paeniroseomonas aquatica]|uniref:Heparinase II/III-family protein n=1 Tax=Paeniroseomonas aquatica TaxID=373043 RepID=A0ABT8A9I9_9PROT|nr:heparinase II/III-family protein [Paeniroseomonas aquatica]MDN3566365.1 heparinase II/III-family protein [Paeniroseomonas aquatica]
MEYPARWFRIADAACRLGPRPVLLAAWHRGPVARRRALRALADAPPPHGPWWPSQAPPPPPGLPAAHRAAVLARAAALAEAGRDWHGPFPAAPHALSLDLFAAGDIRPVWERNRWAELPLLAQAARLEPAGGWSHRAAGFLADWAAANPAFHGPNWACAQEAALRALHLALALALLGAAPPPGARGLLALHGRRIAATPAYALAQDNNHAISEPAGLLACGLLLRDAGWVATGEARLAAARRRLIAADGGFAQLSTGYHRLLLDVLALAEWLRRRHGLPATGEAAAVRWLHRLVDPATGAMPRLGHQDGSAFADLALAGPADARPSLERAARLLAGAGTTPDPGCAWLGLAAAPALPPPEPAWVAGGLRGWQAGGARGVLRIGPLRFRPGHADLLHFDLWDGPRNLLRDGGTGAYNPWHVALAGTAGHNTVEFDGRGQMPAVSRFLFARWPRGGPLPDGGWIRDHRGNRHERRVTPAGRLWRIEDRLAGPWQRAALRWRLAPGPWRLTADGASGPFARLRIAADGPVTLALEAGEESLAYGVCTSVPVLVARVDRPVCRLTTLVILPD